MSHRNLKRINETKFCKQRIGIGGLFVRLNNKHVNIQCEFETYCVVSLQKVGLYFQISCKNNSGSPRLTGLEQQIELITELWFVKNVDKGGHNLIHYITISWHLAAGTEKGHDRIPG
jgi:hypothetical protein